MNARCSELSRRFSQARAGLIPQAGDGARPRQHAAEALLALLAGYCVPIGVLAVTGRDEDTIITASSAASC